MEAGFTLLEVFIATAILGVAILYMFDALAHSPDRANRAKLVTDALRAARVLLHEDDLVALGGEAGRADRAHVAESEDGDSHRQSSERFARRGPRRQNW